MFVIIEYITFAYLPNITILASFPIVSQQYPVISYSFRLALTVLCLYPIALVEQSWDE